MSAQPTSAITLGPAYPNPFTASATLLLTGVAGTPYTVRIIDITGRVVRTVSGQMTATTTSVIWDGRTQRGDPAPIGTYLARVEGTRRGVKIARQR